VKEKRRGIASWSISRPIGTIMITSTLLVLGMVYVGRIPVDLLPRIVYPQVRVNVSNPGVEPAVLEETVAKPLEAALATTEGLTRMAADVSTGNVGITLDFKYGTDVDFALQDAAKNVERIRGRLPEEADPPNINKSDPSQQQIYQVAFSSGTRNQIALRQWVDQRLRPTVAVGTRRGCHRDLRWPRARDPGRARPRSPAWFRALGVAGHQRVAERKPGHGRRPHRDRRSRNGRHHGRQVSLD
jgi:hypothetical protein